MDQDSECCRAQRGLLAIRYDRHIISVKAMKVRMPHSELKWEILNKRNIVNRENRA
jgi:hypothetical protein